MLVEHQVEAEFVGQQIFVVIAMEQIGGALGIARAVRQVDAQIAVRVVPGVRIGMLAEMINSHDERPSMNAWTRRANSSGCSRCGKWPAFATVSKRAPGIRPA